MPVNEVRAHRIRRGWSQEDLTKRAGISAIETGRLVLSTAAALGLDSALACTVEALFGLPGTPPVEKREGRLVFQRMCQIDVRTSFRQATDHRLELGPAEGAPGQGAGGLGAV